MKKAYDPSEWPRHRSDTPSRRDARLRAFRVCASAPVCAPKSALMHCACWGAPRLLHQVYSRGPPRFGAPGHVGWLGGPCAPERPEPRMRGQRPESDIKTVRSPPSFLTQCVGGSRQRTIARHRPVLKSLPRGALLLSKDANHLDRF